MADFVGVPAGSNPDYRSEGAVPVYQDARNHFAGAVEVPGYEMGSAATQVAEPTLEERILANRQFEEARLSKVREAGFDVSDTEGFQYADHRPELFVHETNVDLDFEDDVVDENGDIVEDDEFSVDPELLASAVPVPEERPKRGRPRSTK